MGILFHVCHTCYFELYARIKLEMTGSRPGIFVVAVMLSIVNDPLFLCALQKIVKGTFSFVNCYL
jgi:hypothetical protein